MKARIRKVASVATIVLTLGAAGLVAMPPVNAGLGSEPAAPPLAYTIESAFLAVSCRLATVDLQTGATTVLPAPASPGACVSDLAVAPDGSVWGIIESEASPVASLVQFDPATGAVLSTTPFTGDFSDASAIEGGLAFDGAGTLYVQLVTDGPGCVDGDAVCLYTADPATAATTLVGDPGASNFFTPMWFLGADCGAGLVTGEGAAEDAGASGGEDFGAGGDVDPQVIDLALSSYDKATGALSFGPAFASDFSLAGLDYSRQDGTLYALGVEGLEPVATDESPAEGDPAAGDDIGTTDIAARLFTVDPATAAVTEVAPLSEPALNFFTLAIAGQCPAAPIVLEPTFTG